MNDQDRTEEALTALPPVHEPGPRGIIRPEGPWEFEHSRGGPTHDVRGGGNPRLVAVFDDSIDLNERLGGDQVPAQFPLRPGVTTIGSDPAATIVLPLTARHQAEVRRDDRDEYHIVDTSPDHSSTVDGRPAVGQSLHTGNRLSLGPWTFIYARAESADHGEPYGGHTGGLLHGHPKWQPTPRPRGTSPSGGSEPTADDPGEYY